MNLEQDFKELNLYLDQLCINGHEVKDAGHLWIAFTDKFNAFKKRLLADAAYPDVEEQLWRQVLCFEVTDIKYLMRHYHLTKKHNQ